MTLAQRQELDRLMLAFTNAVFDCGAFGAFGDERNGGDVADYNVVYGRSKVARAELVAWIDGEISGTKETNERK